MNWRCLFGHAWRRSRFVALGTPVGEYDVQCTRCHKVESRQSPAEEME
jgi:hypothetical protein